MIRDDIKAALIAAMKGGDKPRTGAIRLIQSALKDRDIELRGTAKPPEDDVAGHRGAAEDGQAAPRIDRDVRARAAAQELAEAEAAEVAVIEGFLPRQMSEAEPAPRSRRSTPRPAPRRSRTWAGSWPC